MGLLKDAVDLGYITLDQYNDLASEWSSYGYDTRHYGDVESLQNMLQDFLDLGFLDIVDTIAGEYYSAIDYWESLSDYTIYYETDSKHWRSSETGQYVNDPYEWIRD